MQKLNFFTEYREVPHVLDEPNKQSVKSELQTNSTKTKKKTCNRHYVQLKRKINNRNIQRYKYPQRLTH